jgi:hypothetical protein
VKRDLAALEFEAPVVAPVVPEPEREEKRGHDTAEENGTGGKFEHADAPNGAGASEAGKPKGRRTRAKKKTRRTNRRVSGI